MTDLFSFEGILLAGAPGDTFADFYRACVRPVEGARLPASELRTAYEAWCTDLGVEPASQRRLVAFMRANGHPSRKSNVMYFDGAALGDFAATPLPKRSLPMIDGRATREAINVIRTDVAALIGELQSIDRRLARLLPTGKRSS